MPLIIKNNYFILECTLHGTCSSTLRVYQTLFALRVSSFRFGSLTARFINFDPY
jgi:hypothetical protein